MVKHYTNFNIKKLHRGSIILIGNFDGLHLGHQKLFQLAQSYKKKYNLKIGVVNFDPMPKMFFNKKLKNFRLSNIGQKIKLLSNFKVDFVITKKFDKKFSKTKALNFITEILSKKLSSKFMPDAIKAGGTKLDHFDGFLSGNYRKYGFQTLTQIYDWDEEYKPEGWFYPMTNVFDENTSVYAKAFKQLYNSKPAELPTEEVTISVESGFQRTCIPIDKWVMYRRGMPDVIFRKL